MGENVTIKEYMKLNGYKTADANFDVFNLDPDCIFIGDVYVVKYKPKYDYFASFEEQTTLKLKKKDVLLLRVGFEKYINLSNIKTKKDLELVKKKLLKNTIIDKNKGIILGSFFKPYAGDEVVLDVRPYEKENQKNENKQKVKSYKKILFK